MNFTFLILSLTAVVIFILWFLFKPKNYRRKKKVRLKKKSTLKKKAHSKKQENIDLIYDQIGRKKVEQMKKNPEVISQVVRIWLNEK